MKITKSINTLAAGQPLLKVGPRWVESIARQKAMIAGR